MHIFNLYSQWYCKDTNYFFEQQHEVPFVSHALWYGKWQCRISYKLPKQPLELVSMVLQNLPFPTTTFKTGFSQNNKNVLKQWTNRNRFLAGKDALRYHLRFINCKCWELWCSGINHECRCLIVLYHDIDPYIYRIVKKQFTA